jgi:hypothetical protein
MNRFDAREAAGCQGQRRTATGGQRRYGRRDHHEKGRRELQYQKDFIRLVTDCRDMLLWMHKAGAVFGHAIAASSDSEHACQAGSASRACKTGQVTAAEDERGGVRH